MKFQLYSLQSCFHRVLKKKISALALNPCKPMLYQPDLWVHKDPYITTKHPLPWEQVQKSHIYSMRVCLDMANHSLAHQLSICNSQLNTLLSGMGNAVSQVTHAELNVNRRLPGAFCFQEHQYLDEAFSDVSEEDMSQLPASMFPKLAALLPQLQHLSLKGYCEDAALREFGLRCPRLKSLKIDAIQTQLKALRHIDQALPNLTHFILHNRGPLDTEHWHGYYSNMRRYVDSCCLLLTKCKELKVLQLDLWAEHRFTGPELVIECSKHVWDNLPPSLEELRCDVELRGILACLGLVSRVRVMHLADIADCRLPELMMLAPCLEKLTVEHGQKVEVMWKHENISWSELSVLKARLLDGFWLSCDSVSFTGSSVAVRDMMTWLPPLHDTTYCDVVFTDTVHDLDLLDQLARVFPVVVHLSFVDARRLTRTRDLDEGVLKALACVRSLRSIDMRLQLVSVDASDE